MIVRRLGLAALGIASCLLAGPPTARAGLEDYVRRPDSAFAWKAEGRQSTEAGTYYDLTLTSQVWKGITWKHVLRVYEPKEVTSRDGMLLFITGHANGDRPSADDARTGFGLAQLCGARVAVLYQVPNQPLLDGKSEDELIAETLVRWLDTKDDDWPLLFPMVKSAVRAMDALQAWAEEASAPVAKFVVTGASKRGWTTWLTAAVDRRVAAAAPMVIVMLNLRAQNKHQIEVWGKYSEQIEDYVRRDLVHPEEEEADRRQLREMIDPYTYRDKIAVPKLLINGANDRYWTHDALDNYWDDLKGPKNVVFLPNAGHGLEQHRDYATHGIAALFRATMKGRLLPAVAERREKGPDGTARLVVEVDTIPRSAQFWTARSDTRDFRESTWEPTPLTVESLTLQPGNRATIPIEVPRPETGNVVIFADLSYEIDGLPYHLTTRIWEPGARPSN